jgi:hypothetical protein
MGKTNTRAGATGTIDIDALKTNGSGKANGFGVLAYHTNTSVWDEVKSTALPNFMYNERVYWDGSSKWIYSPIKFWPNDFANGSAVDNNSPESEDVAATGSQAGGKVSFFAYAPYVELTDAALTGNGITHINGKNVKGGTADTDGNLKLGDPTVTYSLASGASIDESANVDLLWGTRTTDSYNLANGGTIAKDASGAYQDALTPANYYNTDLTKQQTAETVDFLFKHALTKISDFKVVADTDGNSTTPTTSGYGTHDSNTEILLNTIKIADNSTTPYRTGIFHLSTGVWSNHATANDFEYTYTTGTTGVNTAVWETVTPSYAESAWNPVGVKPNANPIQGVFTSNTPSLFLIPNAEQKLEITVTYTVRTYDEKLAVVDGVTCSKVQQTIKNIVTLPATVLQPNKKLTLVLHLGLTSVKFAADVTDWITGETEAVWLPSNTGANQP